MLELRQQYQTELALLNYLSGESENATVKLKAPQLTEAPSSTTNIFFQQFKSDSLKITNSNRIIDAAYKPSLSVMADAGYNSSLQYEAYKNFGASIGLGVSIPIYDGSQRRLQRTKNMTSLETVAAYRANFTRQYRQQIYMLTLKLSQAREIADFLKSQLVVAEALIESNKKLLLTGDVQISEYILALRNFVAIRNGIAQNGVAVQQLINELNYWKYDD